MSGRRLRQPQRYDSIMGETNIQLDHCVIAVSEWERSNAIYRDLPGAEIVDHPDVVSPIGSAINNSTCTVPAWTWAAW